MGFRLVPKSVTACAVILRYSTEFGRFGGQLRIKVVEDMPLLSAEKCSPKNLVLAIYNLRQYSQRFLRTNSLEAPPVKSDNQINTALWQTVRDKCTSSIRAFDWYQFSHPE